MHIVIKINMCQKLMSNGEVTKVGDTLLNHGGAHLNQLTICFLISTFQRATSMVMK